VKSLFDIKVYTSGLLYVVEMFALLPN
jgi:hypothetical protein